MYLLRLYESIRTRIGLFAIRERETITYDCTPKALILDVILSFGFLKNNHYICKSFVEPAMGSIFV